MLENTTCSHNAFVAWNSAPVNVKTEGERARSRDFDIVLNKMSKSTLQDNKTRGKKVGIPTLKNIKYLHMYMKSKSHCGVWGRHCLPNSPHPPSGLTITYNVCIDTHPSFHLCHMDSS